MDGPHFPTELKSSATVAHDSFSKRKMYLELNCIFLIIVIGLLVRTATGRTGHYQLSTESLPLNVEGTYVLRRRL